MIHGLRQEAPDDSLTFLADEGSICSAEAIVAERYAGQATSRRRVISGIIHVLKSGGRWIDAPDFYGPHKTLYNRFVRWAAKGVWMDIFHTLVSAGGPPAQVLIDSSAVKAHRCASGGKGGSFAKRSADRVAVGPRRSML